MKKILIVVFIASLLSCNNSNNVPWPDGKIPYRAVGFSSDEMIELFSCMMEWQNKTGWAVEFVNVDVVDWNGANQVTIIRDASYLGGISVTGPGYNRTQDQYYIIGHSDGLFSNRFVFLHELGHIIGVDHEHQRPDRDLFVTILWDEIRNKETAFIAMGTMEPSFYDWKEYPYDYSSIMHYRQFDIIDFQGNEELAMKDEVSEIDAWKVRDIYTTQEDTDGELEF